MLCSQDAEYLVFQARVASSSAAGEVPEQRQQMLHWCLLLCSRETAVDGFLWHAVTDDVEKAANET